MMAEGTSSKVWLMRLAYLALGLGVIFFQLMPLETTPRRFAGPDLLVCLSFAWAVRRPDYVAALSVGGLILLADLLFQRPPGLWAALMVIGTHTLKRRGVALATLPFAAEWLSVSLTYAGMMLANRLVLGALLVPQAPLSLTVTQAIATLLAYPFIVGVFWLLLGLRKSTPGEIDGLGQRL